MLVLACRDLERPAGVGRAVPISLRGGSRARPSATVEETTDVRMYPSSREELETNSIPIAKPDVKSSIAEALELALARSTISRRKGFSIPVFFSPSFWKEKEAAREASLFTWTTDI